jgi:antitoxin (DNA-binding transcriptional repressor) of toxin-antitoxin stability system
MSLILVQCALHVWSGSLPNWSGAGTSWYLVETTHYLIYFMVMIRTNIHDVKTHLSAYLGRLEQEKEIVICKRNVPIARIVPLSPATPPLKRALGSAALGMKMEKGFWDPLDEETLSRFDGR